MKKQIALITLLSAGTLFADNVMIWQLGKEDQSRRDFKIHCDAWEYGRAPKLRTSKAMDHKTHTFHYTIHENKLIPNPEVVSGLYSFSNRAWMNEKEIVCNLGLKWNETESGRRLLTIKCVEWQNTARGVDGIEILLPGGKKQVLNLPDGSSSKTELPPFEVVFDAQKGENRLTICNVSLAKHYRFHFDAIKLSKTDRPVNLKAVPQPEIEAFSGIVHPGDPVKLKVSVCNTDNGTVSYRVRDFDGKTVKTGTVKLEKGVARAVLPSDRRGYFSVETTFGNVSRSTSYVVLEPAKPEYIADSRFGCHAIQTDGYTLNRWPEQEALRMKRASLGGARWVRLHSISWALREPQPGKYIWDGLDESFELAKKYKFHILLAIGQTPRWTSPSNNTTLTICGNYRWLYYPPDDHNAWAKFLTEVVKRYKGTLKHYEIGNEPGYSSAFWINGSAPDYGKYLKTAYEAIKKADPEAVVYPGAPLSKEFLQEAIRSTGGKPTFDVLSAHYLGNHRRNSPQAREWKETAARMGAKQELVNSEDMSWEGGKTPAETTSRMLKLFVREAALGITRTFGFMIFSNDSSNSNYGFFDNQSKPRPQAAAYRALTHRLEHAKYVGDLSTSEYEAYLFDRKGTPVIVFWKEQPGTVRFMLGTDSARLVDAMDVEKDVPGNSEAFELSAAAMPQYLEGGDLELLAKTAQGMKALPKHLMLKPGKKTTQRIQMPKDVAYKQFELPAKYNAKYADSILEVTAPANAAFGIYEGALQLNISGKTVSVPVILEVADGKAGSNRIRNGNFEHGTAYFFFAGKTGHNIQPGFGLDGSKGLCTEGSIFFGSVGEIKVRPGERYVLAADIRGEGMFGAVYSILDKNGKKIFPKKAGINALHRKATPEWERISQVISIDQKDASYLSIAYLVNHGDKTGKKLFVDNLMATRLSDSLTVSKLLNTGVFSAPESNVVIDGKDDEWKHVPAVKVDRSSQIVYGSEKEKWKGFADLSGTCRMMMDSKNLYLFFDIRDDKLFLSSKDPAGCWQNDSIQFAIDPRNSGQDRTEFGIGCTPDGKGFVYKYKNYWTPELPENITRNGLVKKAEIVVLPKNGGVVYELRIPLNELYPLNANAEEIGFSYLINDNDGHGRKYMEWSGGIGGNKAPGNYGTMVKQK